MKSISEGLDTEAFMKLNTSLVNLNGSVNDITAYNYTRLSNDISQLKSIENILGPVNVHNILIIYFYIYLFNRTL